MKPKMANAIIIVPNGTESRETTSVVAKVGSGVSEGCGVNVGRRVLVGTMTNCAASVGSMVEVIGGTGVGGGSTIDKLPGGETCTNGEYTQPFPFGADGNSI